MSLPNYSKGSKDYVILSPKGIPVSVAVFEVSPGEEDHNQLNLQEINDYLQRLRSLGYTPIPMEDTIIVEKADIKAKKSGAAASTGSTRPVVNVTAHCQIPLSNPVQNAAAAGGSSTSNNQPATRQTVRNSRRRVQQDLEHHHHHHHHNSCCREDIGDEVVDGKRTKPADCVALMTPEELREFAVDGEDYDCRGCRAHHAPSVCDSESSDECRGHHDTPCRHGHNLTPLVRTSEDCRTCLRHMGGAYVSPRYPMMRQRMLKTLNQRRDHSEELSVEHVSEKTAPISKAPIKSIPCGKKERLILVNPETQPGDVDDLVRMIEGTGVCNDPRKAAKKARQKEKKIQQKEDEEKQQKEEERKRLEEEERIRREQEMREEEEKRKAEEQKRLARKIKKKNRKKKDADKGKDESNNSWSNNGLGETLVKEYGAVQPLSVVQDSSSGGPAETVRKAFENIGPAPENADGKTRMVTIRRHPCTTENQNVVTITLSDDNEGKHPVYMLVNGHLYLGDNNKMNNPQNDLKQEPDKNLSNIQSESDRKKKKKKKITSSTLDNDYCSSSDINIAPQQSASSYSDVQDATYTDDTDENVDLSSLNLPPGITITKVPNMTNKRNYAVDAPSTSSNVNHKEVNNHSGYHSYSQPANNLMEDRNFAQRIADDDILFLRPETEEFEEVVSSKTRKKRNKAAKTKELGETSEPSTNVQNKLNGARRKIQMTENLSENPVKWGNGNIVKTKPGGSKINTNGSNVVTLEKSSKFVPGATNRQQRQKEYINSVSNHYPNNSNAIPVMPRLRRINSNKSDTSSSLSRDPSNYIGFWPRGLTTDVIEQQQQQQQLKNNNISISPTNYMPQMTATTPTSQFPDPTPTSNIPQQQITPTRAGGSSWGGGANEQSSQFVVNNTENSWNPWKNWSEQSTPDNSSPGFGLETKEYTNYKETSTKTMTFHELTRKSTLKSPIQRPISRNSDYYSHSANGSDYDLSKGGLQYSNPTSISRPAPEYATVDLHHKKYQPQSLSPFLNSSSYDKSAYSQVNDSQSHNIYSTESLLINREQPTNSWSNFQPGGNDPALKRRASDQQQHWSLSSANNGSSSYNNKESDGSFYNLPTTPIMQHTHQQPPNNVTRPDYLENRWKPENTPGHFGAPPSVFLDHRQNDISRIKMTNQVHITNSGAKNLLEPFSQMSLNGNSNDWYAIHSVPGGTMEVKRTEPQQNEQGNFQQWGNNSAYTSNY